MHLSTSANPIQFIVQMKKSVFCTLQFSNFNALTKKNNVKLRFIDRSDVGGKHFSTVEQKLNPRQEKWNKIMLEVNLELSFYIPTNHHNE